jgi:hypothetical protein
MFTFISLESLPPQYLFSSRSNSTVNDHSVIKVQVFDASKFNRKKDSGVLGLVSVQVSELDLFNHGMSSSPSTLSTFHIGFHFNPSIPPERSLSATPPWHWCLHQVGNGGLIYLFSSSNYAMSHMIGVMPTPGTMRVALIPR